MYILENFQNVISKKQSISKQYNYQSKSISFGRINSSEKQKGNQE